MDTLVAARCRVDVPADPLLSTSGSLEPHRGQNPIHFDDR